MSGTLPAFRIKDAATGGDQITDTKLINGSFVLPAAGYNISSAFISWAPQAGVSDPFAHNVTLSPTQSTTYTVTVNDASVNPTGCCTGRSMSVDVYDLYIKSEFIGQPNFLTTTYQLNAVFTDHNSYTEVQCPVANTNCNTYKWYKCTGAALGSCSWTHIPAYDDYNQISVSISENTFYKCIMNVDDVSQNLFGCNGIVAIVFLPLRLMYDQHISPLRIEDKDKSNTLNNSIIVYPNPSDGKIYLKINSNELISDNSFLFYLSDMTGKTIYSEQLSLSNENGSLIQLPENIAEGIYILTIRNNAELHYYKIIIGKP